ncbi:MAG: tetratricopeptide repeat protein, partial [Verrucomicrobia bacterium]|nr:tetratricopeptide repeat protein [Verrucomicrobiota bacterium]
MWRSAFVAAFFAWHPLHVESVAWAAERKDVLSTFFFLLTIWAYSRYAEGGEQKSEIRRPKPEGGRENAECRMQNAETRNPQPATLLTPPVSRYYVLSLFLFALGLMSKPMLVTLPFVLLLLDYWPLQRLRLPMLQSSRFEVPPPAPESSPLWPLVREKLPFFALALAASIVTYLVQRSGGAVSSLELLPIHSRITNALVAYFRYLSLTLWPAQLAVVYPYSRQLAAGSVIAAALLLAGASGFFLSRVRHQPYLVVGWLWFLGTLVPTIGLVQVGPQCMADRYTYIPSIGLFLLIVWGLDALLDPWPPKRRNSGSGILPLTGLDALLDPWPPKRLCAPAVGTLALAACLACSCRQLTYWQDSETLFRHAIAATTDNYVAHTSLGKALLEQGKPDEAAVHLAKAIRLTPDDPEAHYNLGTVRIFQDRPDQAAACFSEALRLKPDYGAAHRNLGVILISQGKPDQGAAHLAAAVKFKPDDPETHFNFGFALLELTRPREAADQFSRAIRLNPDSPSS